jgi:K+-transporting ATPase c subunit
MSKVIYEGWMVRYGRRKIGRSFIHRRYFVLEPRLLAYYKKKPQDNRVITSSSSSSSLLSEIFNVIEKKKELT